MTVVEWVISYLLNVILWLFDTGFNVVFLGGSPYESISSRVGKQRPKKWACIVCKMLDGLFGSDHCDKAKADDYDKTLSDWWKF